MSNGYEHGSQAQQVNASCLGKIGGFEKGVLRIIEYGNDFTNDEQTQEEGKILNEYIFHSAKQNEAIVATDVFFK